MKLSLNPLITLLLLAAVSASPLPQTDPESTRSLIVDPTTRRDPPSPTQTPTPSPSTPTETKDATAPLPLSPDDDPSNQGSEYYPNDGSLDYTPTPENSESSESAESEDQDNDPSGESTAFMGMSKGAQIGIIVGAVVGALGLFGGVVGYYVYRRRAWRREVVRRSMVIGAKGGDVPEGLGIVNSVTVGKGEGEGGK